MSPTRQPSTPAASRAAGKSSEGRIKLRLYNTATGSIDEFEPADPKRVRIYVCGPTVYDFAHIGNARPVIVFDVLFRLLRYLYGVDHVRYVRNITDLDDKINARAERDYPDLPLNEAIAKVTEATERQFQEDVEALGALKPTLEPHATQYISEMRAMIERLVARGVAYVAEDHVLFSPSAMNALPGAPRYGALARRSLDEMLAGARVDVAPYKRDPMDFVLWKPSKPNEPGWPSPGGIETLGRPGWHIECSAMSMATLLEPFGGGLECDDPDRNTFDIHGGGIDLVFPHHENEIAQSCCAFGSKRMASFWLHNGFLQVESEKMSKSLGNFVTIRETLLKFPGDAARLNMLRTHYRYPVDWSEKAVVSAMDEIRSWAEWVVDRHGPGSVFDLDALGGTIDETVVDALADDLNTPLAITRLRSLFERAQTGGIESTVFIATARFLGLRNLNQPGYFDTGFSANLHESGPQPSKSDQDLLLSFRAATANSSDSSNNSYSIIALRDKGEIEERGFKVTINDAGVLLVGNRTSGDLQSDADFEAEFEAEIENLVAQRRTARAHRNWPEADRLRDELRRKGVEIKDGKDGTTWKFKSSKEPKR
jgi:cysteinyl-tRNA synthetase